jgi:acyl-CoA thioester hydrolase
MTAIDETDNWLDESLLTVSERPVPARSVSELYPLRYTSTMRFADLDVLGHMNNVAHSALHEDGRTMLAEHAFPKAQRLKGCRHVVAQNTLHFLAEAFYPGELTVCAGVGRIGGKSFVASTALFSEGRCVSLADTVMVIQQDGRNVAISQADRRALLELRLRRG